MEVFYGVDWKDRLVRGDGVFDDEEEEDELQEEEESEEFLSVVGLGSESVGFSYGGDGGSGRVVLVALFGVFLIVGEELVFLDLLVEKLKEVFKRSYEFEKESLQKFVKRLYRLVEVLDLEGEVVDEKEMERRVV